MGLGDCTVGTWGYYTDPVSSATFLTSLQKIWRTGDIHLPMNEDACIHYCPYVNMLRNYKVRIVVL